MRLRPALARLVVLPLAVAAIEFVNPPLPGDTGDFSENPVYEVGSSLEIVWTPAPEGVPVSVVMWQEDIGNEGLSSGHEDIVLNAVDLTRFSWIVGTRKNLEASPVFFFGIFERGQNSPSATCHYFNITRPEAGTTTEPSSTGTSTSTSISSTSAASTSTTESSGTNNIAPTVGANAGENVEEDVEDAAGLSTGAAIGIGVAIPCALILGAIAGYLLVRRRKREADTPAPPIYSDANGGQLGGQWPPMTAVSKYPPVELSESPRTTELPA
ncbi:Very low-density lipoprotein receptor [Madurella mycetomatis]|uniref:Very low-density lipoprotein receptor n=1 Tax=Madurella mycetomatis TaxID=100816 RepID=A0A175VP73_9PEZI|nr:Very low-density lipoprotein receptor [Madurella mycetomatis]